MFIEEFIKYNTDEGYDDIIQSIRFPFVSSSLLLNCWEFSVLGKNPTFLNLLLEELKVRRNLPRYSLIIPNLEKNQLKPDDKSFNQSLKKTNQVLNNNYSEALNKKEFNAYKGNESNLEKKDNNYLKQLPCPTFEVNNISSSEVASELDPYIKKIGNLLCTKTETKVLGSKEHFKKQDKMTKQEKKEEKEGMEINENREHSEMSDTHHSGPIQPALLINSLAVNSMDQDSSLSNNFVSSFNEAHPREYYSELSCRDKFMYILNKCIGKGIIQMKNVCLQNKINKLKSENEAMKKLFNTINKNKIMENGFEEAEIIPSKALTSRINIPSDDDNNKSKIEEIKHRQTREDEKENRRSSKKRIKCKARNSLNKKKQI